MMDNWDGIPDELAELLHAALLSGRVPDADRVIAWLADNAPRCAYVVYVGSRCVDPEPAETCDDIAVPGSEFCHGHQGAGDA